MQFLCMLLFSFSIVAADQVSKLWVVQTIPLYGHRDFIPGLVSLTYVQNTGAAFSMLQGMRWLFVVLFVAITLAMLWEYFRKPLPFTTLERWCLAAIYGGGLGNIIDRVRLGYVVDMIQTDFMDFPVFNVADSFITCGCIGLLIHLAFFNKKFWKDENK